eukprot:GGOE01027257.1.p1 GENE.GGOE01027257.1~~GGOE01027257.1.p1  ORF type:complete len:417 (+),score=111.36 GGOE01027257.1:50-1252(+)
MPERYLCPITTEIMMDPVMDHHGHNFERSAITEWLGRSEECPFSREAIQLGALYPNLALKEEISEWLAQSHPMFSFTGLTSARSSPTTSVGEPVYSTSLEPSAVSIAPWEKLNVDQDYYDRLMALFLSFGAGEMNQSKLQALCRYMNFVEASGHLDELLPGDFTPSTKISFEDFMMFVQKYPPHPVLEYGMSEPEYAAILKKFQALDLSGQGKVTRDAILTLVEDVKFEYGDADPLDNLPEEAVTLHDFLLRIKHCRLLVARRSSILCTASRPKMKLKPLDLRPLSLEQWKFPLTAGSSACANHSPTIRGSPRARSKPDGSPGPRTLVTRPTGSIPAPAVTRGSPTGASPQKHSPKPRPTAGMDFGSSDPNLPVAVRLGSSNEHTARTLKLRGRSLFDTQ